jgi:hypothetical protein
MRFIVALLVLAGFAWGGYRIYEQAVGDNAGQMHHNSAAEPLSLLRGSHSTTSLLAGLLHSATRASYAGQSPLLSRSVPAATYHGAVHYAPSENLEAIDASAIVNSHCDHLDVAMYSFTDWELAEAITRFAGNGRKVRIYRDREQYDQEDRRGSHVGNLFHGNRNIAIRVKGSRILMHIKGWSDGCTLREGSANWSPSGEKQQDNTLTLTADPGAIRAYEANFNKMWSRADNQIIQ